MEQLLRQFITFSARKWLELILFSGICNYSRHAAPVSLKQYTYCILWLLFDWSAEPEDTFQSFSSWLIRDCDHAFKRQNFCLTGRGTVCATSKPKNGCPDNHAPQVEDYFFLSRKVGRRKTDFEADRLIAWQEMISRCLPQSWAVHFRMPPLFP